MLLFIGAGFLTVCGCLASFTYFSQDKEAKLGKSEKDEEAKEGFESKGQEDPRGKDEEGPEEEESETDYSSADENILTQAGRR